MALCLLACSGRPISAAQMAPGLKGFNIDHGPPRSGPIGGSVAIEPQVDARRPLLFEPSRASESSSDGGRSWPSARLGKYSTALNIFASLGIFGVMALHLVTIHVSSATSQQWCRPQPKPSAKRELVFPRLGVELPPECAVVI